MEIIKSLNEAYSMQPNFVCVCTDYEHYYDKPNACKEIVFERQVIGTKCGDPVEELYYVGYNFQGEKIFQYLANAVNIHYFPSQLKSSIGEETEGQDEKIIPDQK